MKNIWKMAMPATAVLMAGTAAGFAPDPQPAPERVVVAQVLGGGSFLGIGVSEITAERAKALNLREERGAEVTHVEEDSPASRAGLKTGDVVLEYNSQRVEGTEQFVRLVRETPVGRDVKILISRNGSLQTLTARTGARKVESAKTFSLPGNTFELPDLPKAFMTWRSGILGIEGESVDSQLAQYFGVKEGVLVRSVFKGSAAEKAGLKAGDVITRIDGNPVLSSTDISRLLQPPGSKKSVAVTLTRERREMTITVNLDDEKKNGMWTPGLRRDSATGGRLVDFQ